MALPDLNSLKTQLATASKLILANEIQPSPTLIQYAKNALPELKFSSGYIQFKTPKEKYVIFPYQWLPLALLAVPFYKALQSYKNLALQAAGGDESAIDTARTNSQLPKELSEGILLVVKNDTEDAKKLEKFITDYDSWGGGKSIARTSGDFHYSPILEALNLLAASSNYAVDLCARFSDYPAIENILAAQGPVSPLDFNTIDLATGFTKALENCGFQNEKTLS